MFQGTRVILFSNVSKWLLNHNQLLHFTCNIFLKLDLQTVFPLKYLNSTSSGRAWKSGYGWKWKRENLTVNNKDGKRSNFQKVFEGRKWTVSTYMWSFRKLIGQCCILSAGWSVNAIYINVPKFFACNIMGLFTLGWGLQEWCQVAEKIEQFICFIR